jgi:hypothetical protein
MKKLTTLFAAALLIIGFAVNSSAQGTSASATASATIVTPIAINKTVDMNFGNVAVNTTPGTVILAPDGTRSRTAGVTLPAVAGTVTAASFTVTGVANATYAITLPTTPTTVTSGANTMTVDAWMSTPDPINPNGLLDNSGTQILHVGATLNVAGSQAPGLYVSGTPFVIVVDYN